MTALIGLMEPANIVFIGHCTKDIITIGGETTTPPGGGVYFGAVSAGWAAKEISHTNPRLNVLTIGNNSDFTQIRSELEQCGCNLELIEDTVTTTFIHHFEDEHPDKRISSVGDVARSFRAEDFLNKKGKVFYVNPLFFGEIDPSLFPLLKKGCEWISVDAQGLIRRRNGNSINHQSPSDLESILQSIDILKVDTVEAKALTGIEDPETACRTLMRMGPKFIICTNSSEVTLYTENDTFTSKFTKWSIEGRTGRGDTISAAFILLHFVCGMEVQTALNLAAEATSNKMMHPGAAIESDFHSLGVVKDN